MLTRDPRADALPLDAAEVRDLLGALDGRRVLLAVSGGPDSMALMHCAATHAAAVGIPAPFVATVDHALRPESAAEASAVGDAARKLGLEHAVLLWSGPKPATGVQDAARRARRDLLARHAAAIGAEAVVTAHHHNDQAETVLMRLAAGSGIAGLAGIRPTTRYAGVAWLRPFLSVPKARLVATAKAAGLPFFEDPSNRDARYSRARWRAAEAALAAEGLDATRLARLAARAARADDALEAAALAAERDTAAVDAGRTSFAPGLFDLPAELLIRLLARAVERAAPAREMRLERLEAAAEALVRARLSGATCGRTLAGALIRMDRKGVVTVFPEDDPRRKIVDSSRGGDPN